MPVAGQERLDSVPYSFHNARASGVRHELTWGLFVLGECFGGVHLSMLPTGTAAWFNPTQAPSPVPGWRW